MSDPIDPSATGQYQPLPEEAVGQTPAEAARALADLSDSMISYPIVPGYEILGVLGRGGMGIVYRARHLVLGRETALKFIDVDRTSDPQVIARFRVEAQVVAALQHPNVVRVLEYGECQGRPYMALECLPGGNLTTRLEQEYRLGWAEAVATLEQVAAGVQAAHELGIVHRDLKPANILFTETGEPKVADFGVAKWGTVGLTQTGVRLGTPHYMSPEQASGDTRNIGPASDVWALGVILYECLTGRRPFTGGTPSEILASILRARPPAPSTIVRSVPSALDTVCLECFQKDPLARYATAGDLAKVLASVASSRIVPREPRPREPRRSRWTERIAIGVALVAILVALYGLFFRYGSQFDAEHPMSTFPDPYGEFDPADRKKVGQLKFGDKYNPSTELPPKLRAPLKGKITVGQLEVRPLKIERRPLTIVTEPARSKEPEVARDALVLTLNIRNTSSNLTVHPMDPAFTRKAKISDGSDSKPFTRIVVTKDKDFAGGFIDWPFAPGVRRRYEQEQEKDWTPLWPGQDRNYVVFTDAQANIVNTVSNSPADMQWRVQVRRGPIEVGGKSFPATAIIGIDFRKTDIKSVAKLPG